MLCPNPACGPQHPQLVMTHREGVEIDYCPKCRGVWLDRGELDKLIELSLKPQANVERSDEPFRHDRPRTDSYRVDGHRPADNTYRYPHQPHKRKSWLGDMLDFD